MKYFTLIVIILLFTNCSNEKDCLDYNSMSGLIIEKIEMSECYSYLTDDKYLIKDTVAYKRLPEATNAEIQARLGCPINPSRPPLNFDSIMLVGAKTQADGCIVGYERKITFDTSTHILYYNIDVYNCGDCNYKRYDMNWVSVPRIINADSLIVNIQYH